MKKLFSILVILLLATQADIYAKKVKHLTPTITWELKDDGTLVISGTGEMPTMPRNEYPWAKKKKKITAVHISEGITKIGNFSFYSWDTDKKRYRISKIKLPSTLQSIGENAFHDNNITTLTIPEGVKEIGKSAFAGNNINQVKLPSTLQSIGESAFIWNNISTLTIPEGVKEIGKSAFQYNKISTLSVSAKEIGEDAFLNNPICNLNIGKEVRKIGKEAFAKNSISVLNIPNSVTSIGQDAFAVGFHQDYRGKWETLYYDKQIRNLPTFINDENCEEIGISKTAYLIYNPTAKEYWSKGFDYYENDDYSTALKYFLKGTTAKDQVINGESRKAWCYRYAGMCYESLDDPYKALEMLTMANKLGVYCSTYFVELKIKRKESSKKKEELKKKTEELLKKGQYDLAFNQCIEAYKASLSSSDLEITPTYFENKKDYTNAIKYYKKIYDITKSNYHADKIAQLYFDRSNYTNAIEWFSIPAQNGNKEAQYKLGQSYEKANNKNLAVFWYRKAAEQKHLKAEEALAHYGIYITPQQSTSKAQASNSSSSSSSSSSTTKSSGTSQSKSTQSTYTPEYGFRDVWVQCAQCHGSGKCWSCHGNGWCVSTRYDGSYNSTYQCPICHGTGNCTTCYGTGGHYEKQQYQIK